MILPLCCALVFLLQESSQCAISACSEPALSCERTYSCQGHETTLVCQNQTFHWCARGEIQRVGATLNGTAVDIGDPSPLRNCWNYNNVGGEYRVELHLFNLTPADSGEFRFKLYSEQNTSCAVEYRCNLQLKDAEPVVGSNSSKPSQSTKDCPRPCHSDVGSQPVPVLALLHHSLSWSVCVRLRHGLLEEAWLNNSRLMRGWWSDHTSWNFIKGQDGSYNVTVNVANVTSGHAGQFYLTVASKRDSCELNYSFVLQVTEKEAEGPSLSPLSNVTTTSPVIVRGPVRAAVTSHSRMFIRVIVSVVIIVLICMIVASCFFLPELWRPCRKACRQARSTRTQTGTRTRNGRQAPRARHSKTPVTGQSSGRHISQEGLVYVTIDHTRSKRTGVSRQPRARPARDPVQYTTVTF